MLQGHCGQARPTEGDLKRSGERDIAIRFMEANDTAGK